MRRPLQDFDDAVQAVADLKAAYPEEAERLAVIERTLSLALVGPRFERDIQQAFFDAWQQDHDAAMRLAGELRRDVVFEHDAPPRLGSSWPDLTSVR